MKRVYLRVCAMTLFTAISFCAFAGNPVVVLETNFGNMAIELYPADAPITVDNFLSYVNTGFYDNLVFHRTDKKNLFGQGLDIIQGGSFCVVNYVIWPASFYPDKKLAPPIVNESYNGLSNLRGTIAMARTSEPNSATSGFYINYQDNLNLDRANSSDGIGYCVFGRIIEGLSVMDAITTVPLCYVNSSFPTFPCDPPVVISRAFVRPCDSSYCSNLIADTQINIRDFSKIALHWLDEACGSANGFCSGSDLDYSGTVDMVDLQLFLDHWTYLAGYEPRYSNLVEDGQVDVQDLSVLLSHWLDSTCSKANNYCEHTDLNQDGKVNLQDWLLFSSNWLKPL